MKKFKNVSKDILFFEIKGVSHSMKPGHVAELDPDNKFVGGLIKKGKLDEVDESGNTAAERETIAKKAEEAKEKDEEREEKGFLGKVGDKLMGKKDQTPKGKQ